MIKKTFLRAYFRIFINKIFKLNCGLSLLLIVRLRLIKIKVQEDSSCDGW